VSGAGVDRLTLSHFRSHVRTEMEPGGQSVVLHGANGAGKTNILEAVSLLSPGRGLRRAAAADMARQPGALGWKVTSQIGDHLLETWFEGNGGRQVRIDDKPATQAALGRIVAIVWLTPAMDRLWTEGADGRRRFLDRITLSFRPGHGEAVLTYEKAMRERNRLLKEQVGDARWYEALETQMAQAGVEIGAGRREAITLLTQAQEEAETAFPRADIALVGPDGAVAEPWDEAGLASALASSRPNDLRAGRSLVGVHRADLAARFAAKGMDARDASTGEQKALLISLVLANARALINLGRNAPILLLDEVAAHLDETRRGALYQEIAALGAQAWMTGTGAELFAGLGTDTRQYSVFDGDGASQVEGADHE
jgi:DNA replication and repair protein RecF